MNSQLRELNGVMGKINAAYHEAALKLGISDSVRDIFYVLCDRGSGCPQSVLYKETGMTRSTVNTAIRRLEKEGILYLTKGTGKNTCVILTEKGERVVNDTVGRLVAMEEAFFQRWTPQEQETLLRSNERYAEELRRSVQKL